MQHACICVQRTEWAHKNCTVMQSSLRAYSTVWVWMDGWVGGWMDGWMGGWMDAWMDGWMDGWMGGWVGRWVSEWVNKWMNEWMRFLVYLIIKYALTRQQHVLTRKRCVSDGMLMSATDRSLLPLSSRVWRLVSSPMSRSWTDLIMLSDTTLTKYVSK